MDSSIPVPSNVKTESTTWDSVTFTWDGVYEALFYQIEINGRKSWGATTINDLMVRRLIPDAEHSFRVRAVRENSVSEWSDAVKGRTQKEPFKASGWKECPDDVYWGKR